MELSELAEYAKRKYGIEEEYKWPAFPRFSVLCHPETGKWIALFLRQWDTDSGREIQRCDLKCGGGAIYEFVKPYLSEPVRMKAGNWIGIAFDDQTEPDVVFRLFDRAVDLNRRNGSLIILEHNETEGSAVYSDTPLPFGNLIRKGFPKKHRGTKAELPDEKMPERIRQMIGLYEFGDGSLKHKAQNFYRQGKYMEDYEDDAPWDGPFMKYFTTYHDLSVRQLRGYFTWRTAVRNGHYGPIAVSLAYMYLYELLCGIGTASPEDALCQMQAFEEGFLDAGAGDEGMRRNFCRWRFAFAVLHGFPAETILQLEDPAVRERDAALSILKEPDGCTDEEVFCALCSFAGDKYKKSPVVSEKKEKGMHLFAEVWRYLAREYCAGGRDIFTDCFGKQRSYIWHPFSNAVYYEETGREDQDVVLNSCRSYHLRNGVWNEKRYEPLYYDKNRLQAVVHEADRLFRRYLKTGRYLKEKPEEAWVLPYILQVIDADRLAEEEAARPKIEIDFSSLSKIRSDAMATRDSLLTEEETEEIPELPPAEIHSTFGGLEDPDYRILTRLLKGESADELIRNEHRMPSVVADAINEALFDVIGDNVLECEGNMLIIVEEYKEDLKEVLGGSG